MTSIRRALWAFSFCFLVAGCATTAPSSSDDATPAVLLISIDGFRVDYLERGITPHLARLADAGVRADGMTPSYPTLTFPNHYTLVTGLRPDRHGIVHNIMRDPVLGVFRSSDAGSAGDARWWNDAEPIWVTAERAGLSTATMFWPGSQAPIRGVRPTHWRVYDETVDDDARVDQVVAWLDSATPRIRFATLYFELLDKTGHAFGPDSAEMQRDIAAIDATIGRLLRELETRGLRDRINLVVLSDHGMAEVPPDRVLAIEDIVAPDVVDVLTTGQVVGLQPKADRESEATASVLGRHAHHACWNRDALPARWHYGTHPRVPPIVCQLDAGWDAIPRADVTRRPAHARGSHGFDPALPSMRAFFIAQGPAFRAGVRLPVFENVDVYPLLTHLMGVPPQSGDGTLATFRPALR